MDKKWLQRKIRKFNALKTWQLLILLILTLFLTATALRLNNVGMHQRREAVIAADKSGDEQRARLATIELANYVKRHMNSGGIVFNQATGKFKIEREVVVAWRVIYERDFENAKNKAATAADNPNGNIFKKAEEACRPRFSGGYSPAYLNCILEEQNKYPSAENIVKTEFPRAEKYNFRFISPLWTPDLAGWTVVVAGFLSFFIILKIISGLILSQIIKRKSLKF